MEPGFAFLDAVLPGIRWDAKYATPDNFTGRPVDGYGVARIVVSDALAAALGTAKARAEAEGFGLLVWDAYRPQRAVDRFFAWSQEPEDGAAKARHYPRLDRGDLFGAGYLARRSAHSRGAAIDLTLVTLASGAPADMGTGFDFMDALSHHGAPGIAAPAAAHRQRLRSLMEASGFAAYEPEWWHYALRTEPHPDTCFDFPIA